MRIGDNLHLTYCLNVHAGETWDDQFLAIREHAEPIAGQVAGERPFGLGLRLSADSAARLARSPSELERLRTYLAARGLYVLTVNAFPYGRFHDAHVKDAVYRPDWTQPARSVYTLDAARVLASLLPEGVKGSISTAPLTFKGWPGWQGALPRSLEAFAAAGRVLAGIAEETGRHIVLAMEPEPCCYPETTGELLEVFSGLQDREGGFLGCCFDTAHQAVQFEDLADAVECLAGHGVPLAKIQLSSAIAADTGSAAREQLKAFSDRVYLHQACFRRPDGRIRRVSDLPAALEDDTLWGEGGEVRVHYHVPLFVRDFGVLRSTSDLLCGDRFLRLLRSGISSTLEIETYTWQVWQEATGSPGSVDEGIVREFRWMATHISP